MAPRQVREMKPDPRQAASSILADKGRKAELRAPARCRFASGEGFSSSRQPPNSDVRGTFGRLEVLRVKSNER